MNIPFVDLQAQYRSIKPEIDRAIAAVIEETAFVSGPYASRFESEFAAYSGHKHVISCANGTDSLEILLRAMGIKAGDEIIVPALSWISTSECLATVGAIPVFVDVNEYGLIDVSLIEEHITEKTRAIIPVHLWGQPADMTTIMAIAEKQGLLVIEDCAQSHGAMIGSKKTGTFGHAASFSFYPGKNLGAYGDAGAMATNDDNIAETARIIANHGQVRKHQHLIEGRNSRMDGIQAAILSAKLPHLEKWTEARIRNAALYREALGEDLVECPPMRGDVRHVYHLFVVQSFDRDELMSHLSAQGIGVAIHYPTPLPLLEAYSYLGLNAARFPIASHLCSSIISLPMYAELSESQIEQVAASVRSFFG